MLLDLASEIPEAILYVRKHTYLVYRPRQFLMKSFCLAKSKLIVVESGEGFV